jgi:hypothetical protein
LVEQNQQEHEPRHHREVAAMGDDGREPSMQAGDNGQEPRQGQAELGGAAREFNDRFAKVKADMETSLRRVRELGAHLKAGSHSLETVTGRISQQIAMCSSDRVAQAGGWPRSSLAGSPPAAGDALSISGTPRSLTVVALPTRDELLVEQEKMANYVTDIAKRVSGSGSSWGSRPTSPRVGDSASGVTSVAALTCPSPLSSQSPRPFSQNDVSQDKWGCQYKCGYQSKFQDVELHEMVCAENPAKKVATAASRPHSYAGPEQAKWGCEYECGFCSTFEKVAEHEKSCSLSPAKHSNAAEAVRASRSVTRPETSSGNLSPPSTSKMGRPNSSEPRALSNNASPSTAAACGQVTLPDSDAMMAKSPPNSLQEGQVSPRGNQKEIQGVRSELELLEEKLRAFYKVYAPERVARYETEYHDVMPQ